jgi:cytoskeletal protein CcmA (bactofilin family)
MSRFVMSEKTVISAGSALRGLVRGQGDLRIEGQCFGDIEVTGSVEIVEGALVKATVRGTRITVSGAVSGDLYATESIALEAGARVVGNLSAPSVGIGEGALVRGRVETGLAPETVAPRAIGRPFHGHASAAKTAPTPAPQRSSGAASAARTPASRAPLASATAATSRAPSPSPGASPFAASASSSSSSSSQATPATQAAARSPSAHANANANAPAAPTAAAPSPTSLGSALPPEERKAPPPVVPSLKKGHKASFKKKAGG